MEGAGEGAKSAADQAPGQLSKVLGSLRVSVNSHGLRSALNMSVIVQDRVGSARSASFIMQWYLTRRHPACDCAASLIRCDGLTNSHALFCTQSVLLGKGSVLLIGGTGFVALNYYASRHVDQYYRDQVSGLPLHAHQALLDFKIGGRAHLLALSLLSRPHVCQLHNHALENCSLSSMPAQVYHTLERGFCPEALPGEDGLIERKGLRQRLLTILRQDEPAKCYYLITGEWQCMSGSHQSDILVGGDSSSLLSS